MMALDLSVISCAERYPQSISFSGWPIAKLALPPSCPVSVIAAAYPRCSPAASVAGVIDPVQPPLPLASNFPFHPAAGSQSSILMSESALGFSVAATRQNAGRSLNTALGSPPRPRPLPAGTVNAPAATDCARVIVVCGKERPLRLSQVVPA